MTTINENVLQIHWNLQLSMWTEAFQFCNFIPSFQSICCRSLIILTSAIIERNSDNWFVYESFFWIKSFQWVIYSCFMLVQILNQNHWLVILLQLLQKNIQVALIAFMVNLNPFWRFNCKCMKKIVTKLCHFSFCLPHKK